MPSRDNYDWLMLGIQAFGAVATAGAVIVALYLARKESKPGLRVTCGVYSILTPGNPAAPRERVFKVGVVNTGHRDVSINGIVWRVGWLGRRNFVQIAGQHPLSANFPRKLSIADGADYMYDLPRFRESSGDLRSAVQGSSAAWRRVKVGVYLSSGEEFLVAPDPEVLKALFDV